MRYDHEDWFTRHIPNWRVWLAHLVGKEGVLALEIGSFEGRSARWLLDNVLWHGHLVCVDPFTDAGMNDALTGTPARQVYANFRENVLFDQNVSHICLPSRRALSSWSAETGTFDIVYIDGSHVAKDVLMDCVLSWPLLKVEGTLILDDYTWKAGHADELPSVAIDAFMSAMGPYYDPVHVGHQVCLRKTS